MDIKDLKIGDKVRIVKCRYPTPGISFLGNHNENLLSEIYVM